MNFNRYIIPFHYGAEGQSLRDCIRLLNGKCDSYGGTWVADSVRGGERDMYEYILDSFREGPSLHPENIGAAFRYVPVHASVKNHGHEESAVLKLRYTEKKTKERFLFNLKEAGLYLFSSGVGFLWYEITEPVKEAVEEKDRCPISIESFLEFQYSFKELNYERNQKVFRLADREEPFLMGNWVAAVLQPVSENLEFFAERKNALKDERFPRVPDKAVLFNYGAYEAPMEQVAEYSYYLTKGYKRSYRMPADVRERMRRPFENVIWYVTDEGAGYYAQIDAQNRELFLKDMKRAARNEYFLMYVLALNEEYSILNYAARISGELPADPQQYLAGMYTQVTGQEEDETELFRREQQVTRLSTEIHLFLTKNVRTSVSHIGHQNAFYRYVLEALYVKEDMEALTSGLNSLQVLLQQVTERERMLEGSACWIKWRENEAFRKVCEERDLARRELYFDAATHLLNRRAYQDMAGKLAEQARVEKKLLLVCSADMNGLKYINDNFGHDAGDTALSGSAQILKGAALPEDLVFRVGGDEFMVLGLREEDGAIGELGARMEAEIQAFRKSHQLEYPVDISYGVVLQDMEQYGGTLEELAKQADELMYEMKKGRDPHRRE